MTATTISAVKKRAAVGVRLIGSRTPIRRQAWRNFAGAAGDKARLHENGPTAQGH